MKTLRTLLFIAIAIFGFNATSFGQQGVKATATAAGTIIAPITITKTVDMNFGNVAVNSTPGTVVLTPAGARSATGGVTVTAALGGTVTAATFTVGGEGTSTYSITLPASNIIRIGAAGATMTVDNFVSTPSGTGALVGGAQTINVGATLNVNASQAAGSYISVSPFEVAVNYN